MKAHRAAPLDRLLPRAEACGLATISEAERPAIAAFTCPRCLNVHGAPRAIAPLSTPPTWTAGSAEIHPPASRLQPRATSGCAGFAGHGSAMPSSTSGRLLRSRPTVRLDAARAAGSRARTRVRGDAGGHHSCAPWAARTHFRPAGAGLMARVRCWGTASPGSRKLARSIGAATGALGRLVSLARAWAVRPTLCGGLHAHAR
jgi:hypothetical protein